MTSGDSTEKPPLPLYGDLPLSSDAPPRSSWGIWSHPDVFGCLNLLTPERVRAAAGLVRSGKIFPLNWELELPNPPLFGRRSPRHRVMRTGQWQDDELTSWNTQSSSQWDGFRHARSRRYGYYDGLPNEQHGIHHWARRGIVGRGVLVDIAAYRRSIGRPLRMEAPDPISPRELAEAIAASPATVREGDVLLLHTGWTDWYSRAAESMRVTLARDLRAPGLEPGDELLELLWNLHLSALAADNPSVEVWPPGEQGGASHDEADLFAHFALLPLLGLPLGEMFDLGRLAADCELDGVYEGLFTSAPLNLLGGVASPANALFIK